MLTSQLQVGGSVDFPTFEGERVYMRPFSQQDGLPYDLRRWQTTVDQMLEGITAPGPIYIMIDQSEVQASNTQRRPGLHVDGNWIEDLRCHGGSGRAHHRHPTPSTPQKAPSTIPGRRRSEHHHPGRHAHSMYSPEAIILASDVAACRAVLGTFDGVPGAKGECMHFDVSDGEEVFFSSHRAYVGNVTMLHESLPVPEDCERTLVRLNVPRVTFH